MRLMDGGREEILYFQQKHTLKTLDKTVNHSPPENVHNTANGI